MATLLTRNCFSLRLRRVFHRQRFGRAYACRDSGSSNGTRWKRGKRIAKNCLSVLLAGAGATCGALLYLLDRTVEAIGPEIRLPSYPWEFEGLLTSLDHSAVRRGWQVYRNVCYTCHSLRYMRFMDLINVSHTEDEVKAMAAEFEVEPILSDSIRAGFARGSPSLDRSLAFPRGLFHRRSRCSSFAV